MFYIDTFLAEDKCAFSISNYEDDKFNNYKHLLKERFTDFNEALLLFEEIIYVYKLKMREENKNKNGWRVIYY